MLVIVSTLTSLLSVSTVLTISPLPADKQEQLTKEAWTDDGWFKTGDVAQWNKVNSYSAEPRSDLC